MSSTNDGGIYKQPDEKTLSPGDHFLKETVAEIYEGVDYNSRFSHSVTDHFIRDINDQQLKDMPTTYTNKDGNVLTVFSGSTTSVNPTNDPVKNEIISKGMAEYEKQRAVTSSNDVNAEPPVSPISPFIRINPSTARLLNLTVYNRTRTPIADLVHRKSYQHIFITRPECYVMARNPNGIVPILSEQAQYDEDFSSSFSKMPYIAYMLSPVYVSGALSQKNIISNWNYLLSNAVVGGIDPGSIELAKNENNTRSTTGHTIVTGDRLTSRVAGNFSLTFRETKNIEVFEFLRLWILYIHKRKRGIFAPSFNNYQYKNGFYVASETGTPVNNKNFLHPYDRAIEYTASLFSLTTNETMSRILYSCKYYGIFPTSVTINGIYHNDRALNNDDITVTATFQYQYKVENLNKTFVEFNFNAGITDMVGRVNSEVATSHPFLYQDDINNTLLPKYVGSAGMFTGSPYIVMGKTQVSPVSNDYLVSPFLRFLPIDDGALNSKINIGITNNEEASNLNVVGIID